MLSGIDISYSPYIVMLIPSLMATVFVYYIAKHFTKSERIAVAASFFYLMMPIVLKMAVSSMAYVMATLCFVIILYILTREAESKSPAWIILGVMVTAYMTAVHHASVVVIMAGMAVLIFSYIVYRKKATGSQVMTCGIFCAIPTLYFCKHYLGSIISIITSRVSSVEGKLLSYFPPSTTLESEITEKTNFIQYVSQSDIGTPLTSSVIETINPKTIFESVIKDVNVVLYSPIDGRGSLLDASISDISAFLSYFLLGICTLFLLVGIYHLSNKENINKQYSILLPFSLIFIPIFVDGMVDIAGINIEVDRFRLMIVPIFATTIAVGCFLFYQLLNTTFKNGKIPKVVIYSIWILLIVLSPTYIIPTDAIVYAETENREVNYFNENDIILLEHIENYLPYGSDILSDHIIYRYYTSTKNEYDIPNYIIHNNIYLMFINEITNKQLEYTVFREHLYRSGNLETVVNPFGNAVVCPNDNINRNIKDYTSNKAQTYDSEYNQIYFNQKT